MPWPGSSLMRRTSTGASLPLDAGFVILLNPLAGGESKSSELTARLNLAAVDQRRVITLPERIVIRCPEKASASRAGPPGAAALT